MKAILRLSAVVLSAAALCLFSVTPGCSPDDEGGDSADQATDGDATPAEEESDTEDDQAADAATTGQPAGTDTGEGPTLQPANPAAGLQEGDAPGLQESSAIRSVGRALIRGLAATSTDADGE